MIMGVSTAQSRIEVIKSPLPAIPKAVRAAAYARVSSGKDAQLDSLAAQISYYNRLIQEHPGWVFAGIYADEAVSGTKNSRENFNRLIADCRAGSVDLILTKSISRFARNTVTLLKTVRELKALGVDVYFEEQNIHTLSGEGELMLTILAGFAEEESLSVSENCKWRVRKNFEEGKPWSWKILGYRHENGRFAIVPEEAEIVQRIFREYLSGMGTRAIAEGLNCDGLTGRSGKPFPPYSVLRILRNYTYTGNLLLQKTFSENHLTKKRMKNEGQLPQYHVEAAHEPIVSLEDFVAVQDEIRRRAESNGYRETKISQTYPFTGMIVCAQCGKHYRRKAKKHNTVWICPTFNEKGKAFCRSKQIPEETLLRTAEEIVGDVAMLRETVSHIVADNGNLLTFFMKDGSKTIRRWEDRSRAESWTPEMREAARSKAKEQKNANCNDDPGNTGSANQDAAASGQKAEGGRLCESLD